MIMMRKVLSFNQGAEVCPFRSVVLWRPAAGPRLCRRQRQDAPESERPGRLHGWSDFIHAGARLISSMTWLLLVLLVVAAVGRFLMHRSSPFRADRPIPPREFPTPHPVDWDAVDAATSEAVQGAQEAARRYAEQEIHKWVAELKGRVDHNFLDWYFSYWTQQWLGLKAMGYWAAHKILKDEPTMAAHITEDIQREFAQRVLRPPIAQMRLQRIARETVRLFVQELHDRLSPIPERYHVPAPAWENYLNGLALLTRDVRGKKVTLPLKGLVGMGSGGTLVLCMKAIKSLKGHFARIGSRMAIKSAARGAEKAAAEMAAKTGAKVASESGGKLLGPLVAIGVLVWDLWDHYHTVKTERPVLRKNLHDFLDEMGDDLLSNPDTGLLPVIDHMVENILTSMKRSVS